MDPARPNDPEPSDPFNPERADHAILETIEIATEGEDCDECVRKLRAPLKKIKGVKDVKVDLKHERVIVTFDARKTHAPDLHDAILKSGYKPGPTADSKQNTQRVSSRAERGTSQSKLRAHWLG
jgi:copper chaperone CopZ